MKQFLLTISFQYNRKIQISHISKRNFLFLSKHNKSRYTIYRLFKYSLNKSLHTTFPDASILVAMLKNCWSNRLKEKLQRRLYKLTKKVKSNPKGKSKAERNKATIANAVPITANSLKSNP